MCCAACGIKQLDDIKLKKCTACYLVSYCSVQCQKNHRKQHKKECKMRMVELREELLFKQPESSHIGDCPICCVPLSIDANTSSMSSCCCVLICDGCAYTNQMKNDHSVDNPLCPFCRSHMYRQRQKQSGILGNASKLAIQLQSAKRVPRQEWFTTMAWHSNC